MENRPDIYKVVDSEGQYFIGTYEACVADIKHTNAMIEKYDKDYATKPRYQIWPTIRPPWMSRTRTIVLATRDVDYLWCSICGELETTHYSHWPQMVLSHTCFECDFWIEHIRNDVDNPRVARIDNHHYTIGPDPKAGDDASWLGFSGRKFVIKFDDGHIVVTRNLWHQGEIPERFRSMIPNNAVFEDATGNWVKVGNMWCLG